VLVTDLGFVVVLGGGEFVCASAPIELIANSIPAVDSEKRASIRIPFVGALN
jgi:hypothetical protein